MLQLVDIVGQGNQEKERVVQVFVPPRNPLRSLSLPPLRVCCSCCPLVHPFTRARSFMRLFLVPASGIRRYLFPTTGGTPEGDEMGEGSLLEAGAVLYNYNKFYTQHRMFAILSYSIDGQGLISSSNACLACFPFLKLCVKRLISRVWTTRDAH